MSVAPTRELDEASTVRDEAAAWARDTLQRERAQARLIVLLATALVPAWIPFDYLLEPRMARTFLLYRLGDVAVGLILWAVLARAPTLRVVRAATAVKIVATGSAIALMLPAVADFYWAYVLGFSLLFWATAVVSSMPWGIAAGAFTVIAAVWASAFALGPGHRTAEELAGAAFYILSTMIICLAQVALRGRLEHRAFLSAHRLTVANRKIRESEALKTQFFANVSHELRTPLSLILGPVEKLLRAPELAADQRRDLELVLRSARLLLGHVNRLLDVTRLELTDVRPSYRATDLSALVRAVASDFAQVASERRVAYALEIPDALGAEVDPDQVQAVLLNLLSNAFKVTPPGGRIRCSLRAAEGRAVLEVADSGPGIAPEHRELVFERFRQLDGGANRALAGTGLGLAIARELVRLHGGSIAIEDAAEGGACFRVEVPMRAPAGIVVGASAAPSGELTRQALAELEGTARDEAAGERASGDAPLVLVVEDNPELNRFVRECLAPDYRTAPAMDGEEGLAKALALRPDLVVTDVMMPRKSGAELVAALRARPELDGLPILVLSAREDEALRVGLLEGGAQDYVTKPFSAGELRARVANLVGVKRSRDLLRADLDSREASLERLAREVTRQRREVASALETTRVARDIAEQASATKTSFLRLVSHELRTPLMSLGLLIHRLEIEAAPLSEAERGTLDAMCRAARRLQDLVESLLDYARIESGRLAMQIERFDLAEVAEEAIEDARAHAESKQLELVFEPGAPLPALASDPRLVRLIVLNLLVNAIKFTKTGGVTLQLGFERGEHVLAVRDTGVGIAPDQIARIFEPFEQLEPLRSKHLAGVGLGLALVREMVAALGGRIDVRSVPREGSTFTVRLPQCAERDAQASVRSPTFTDAERAR